MAETEKGKARAQEALAERRKVNETRPRIDNYAQPAGSPMHFDCISCGAELVVPETYVRRPKLCGECHALKDMGWLE